VCVCVRLRVHGQMQMSGGIEVAKVLQFVHAYMLSICEYFGSFL